MLRSLADIEAFTRVARTLNFTKAAAELHVTPTAISKAVARLEIEVGSQLFTRTTRSVKLTEAGELFLHHCTAAFANIEAGLEALEVLRDETVGPVRVSAPFVLGRRLAASLPDFLARHPKLTVQLSLTDDFVDLDDERTDIAIRIGDANLAPHHAVPLAQLNWITVASPHYLQQHGRPAALEALGQHRCHHFINNAGVVVPWRFMQNGELRQITQSGGAEFNQGELLVEIALADGGIVQLFDYMVTDQLRAGDLVKLFTGLEADGPFVHAVMLHGRERSPKINTTLLHMQQLFEQL